MFCDINIVIELNKKKRFKNVYTYFRSSCYCKNNPTYFVNIQYQLQSLRNQLLPRAII